MTIKYQNKVYDVEYTQFNEEDVEIWIQNPNDIEDFHYVEDLPEHLQNDLYSIVDELLYNEEPKEKMGYLD